MIDNNFNCVHLSGQFYMELSKDLFSKVVFNFWATMIFINVNRLVVQILAMKCSTLLEENTWHGDNGFLMFQINNQLMN